MLKNEEWQGKGERGASKEYYIAVQIWKERDFSRIAIDDLTMVIQK